MTEAGGCSSASGFSSDERLQPETTRVALTKASGFRKCERLACLESGARAALAAAKEAVAEASGFAKKNRAFLLIERLIFVTSRLFCLERPC